MLFRNTWVRQPAQNVGVDWDHPLAKGLQFSTTDPLAAISQSGHAQIAGGTGLLKAVSKDGMGVQAGTAQTTTGVVSIPAAVRDSLNGKPCAFAFVTTPFPSSINAQHVYAHRDATTSDFVVGGQSTGLQVAIGANNAFPVPSNLSTATRFVITLDGSNVIVYTNGGVITTTAFAFLPGASTITPSILNRQTGGRGVVPFVSQISVWSRALTPSEAKRWVENPWQIYAPSSRKIWVPAIAGGGGFAASISEAASASDSVSVIIGFAPVAAESASATDAVSGAMAASVSINEAGSASDAASQVTALSGTVSEAASATDAVSSSTAQSGSVSEAASATDAVNGTATGDYAASISEAASAVSAEAAQTNFAVTRSEPASATDLASAVSTYLAAISESAAASETQSSSNPGNFTASIAEAASALDVQAALAAFTVIQVEPANAADSVFAINSWLASVTESALALDAISAFLLDPTTESAWWAYSVLPNRLNYSVALSSLSYSVTPDALNFSVLPEDLAFSIKD